MFWKIHKKIKDLPKEKEYLVDICLGLLTSTFDLDGIVLEDTATTKIKTNIIKKTLLTFPKEYEQKPPVFSAIKVNSKRLYKIAREICKKYKNKKELKEKLERIRRKIPKRKVFIKKIELLKIYTLKNKKHVVFKRYIWN